MDRLKRPARIIGTVVGVLVVAAILIGILNALVADGKWTLGWSDYSYDDSLYQVGDGSIPADQLTSVDIDWIDGTVTLTSCKDSYVSLTESSESELPESAVVRWYVDENGALSIKYRNSSFFLGASKNKNKNLVVRIPEKYLENLKITVEGVSTNFIFSNLKADRVEASTKLGGISVLSDCAFTHFTGSVENERLQVRGMIDYLDLTSKGGEIVLEQLGDDAEIQTESGSIRLNLEEDASFSLDFETEKGRYVSDFVLTEENGYLVCGDGERELEVETESGTLYLKRKQD